MHAPRSPAAHMMPSVGALMDPEFLRGAVADALDAGRPADHHAAPARYQLHLIDRSRAAVVKTWAALTHLAGSH